jgi:predicted SnoaL-like aldol condensation-catalyzing enzyme
MADVKSTTDAKSIVLDFFDLAFNQQKPADAREQFMGSTYTQHNPEVADGPETFVGAIGGMFQAFPDFSSDVKRVIAEGDLVAIHHEVHMAPGDAGMSVVDIFRVDDGKVVEHWDIIQPVPAEAANDNTMF